MKIAQTRERLAYRLNEVGLTLRDLGSERCVSFYRAALRLTRDKGRRTRTLVRLADALVLFHSDWRRALRLYKAALRLGQRSGFADPRECEFVGSRIEAVELDRRGLCSELTAAREQAAKNRKALAAVLGELEVAI